MMAQAARVQKGTTPPFRNRDNRMHLVALYCIIYSGYLQLQYYTVAFGNNKAFAAQPPRVIIHYLQIVVIGVKNEYTGVENFIFFFFCFSPSRTSEPINRLLGRRRRPFINGSKERGYIHKKQKTSRHINYCVHNKCLFVV